MINKGGIRVGKYLREQVLTKGSSNGKMSKNEK